MVNGVFEFQTLLSSSCSLKDILSYSVVKKILGYYSYANTLGYPCRSGTIGFQKPSKRKAGELAALVSMADVQFAIQDRRCKISKGSPGI